MSSVQRVISKLRVSSPFPSLGFGVENLAPKIYPTVTNVRPNPKYLKLNLNFAYLKTIFCQRRHK